MCGLQAYIMSTSNDWFGSSGDERCRVMRYALCRACVWCLCVAYVPLGVCLGHAVFIVDCSGCCLQPYVWFASIYYEHQQWLFWLKWRWKMHRNARCILTCRSPWTNSCLNALCNFGMSLKWGLAHAFVNTAPMFDVCAINVSTFACVDFLKLRFDWQASRNRRF